MLKAVEDGIINGVIKFITTLADYHEETRGLFVIRKYEDGPRPTNSTSETSCVNYSTSTFAEISVDRISKFQTCKSQGQDDCGNEVEISSKIYDVLVRIEFFGCNSIDVAVLTMDAIELINLRMQSLRDGLTYVSHGDMIDTTSLEETTHNKRVTFDINMQYCTETSYTLPTIEMGECMKNFLGINKKRKIKLR